MLLPWPSARLPLTSSSTAQASGFCAFTSRSARTRFRYWCILARGDSEIRRGSAHGWRDHLDAVAEMPGALAQRQRHAFDDHVRPVMLPIVAGDRVDAAADPLRQPIILARGQQMSVAGEHVGADRHHLRRRQARVEVEVFERAVEPRHMLFEAKGGAVEAAGHVEDRVAAGKPWSRNGIRTSLSRTILPLNQATRSFPSAILIPSSADPAAVSAMAAAKMTRNLGSRSAVRRHRVARGSPSARAAARGGHRNWPIPPLRPVMQEIRLSTRSAAESRVRQWDRERFQSLRQHRLAHLDQIDARQQCSPPHSAM